MLKKYRRTTPRYSAARLSVVSLRDKAKIGRPELKRDIINGVRLIQSLKRRQ